MDELRDWMREYGFTALFVLVAAVAAVWWFASTRGNAEPDPEPTPVVSATSEPDAPSPAPTSEPSTPATTPEPEPSTEAPTEEASVDPAVPVGQTVLFRGGPATGPWQQIGSVAEITHPDAPASARFAYDTHWSDPEGANQSDELWDEIVAEVTAQAVELGPMPGRLTFGGAPGSEAFQAFGGLQDVYREDRAFTAFWTVTWIDDDTAVNTYYPYVISFDEAVIGRGDPFDFEVHEDEVADAEEAADVAVDRIRRWAGELGYVDRE